MPSSSGQYEARFADNTVPLETSFDLEAFLRARGGGDDSAAGNDGWCPELANEVYELVTSAGFENLQIKGRVRELEAVYGRAVYAALIFILTHRCLDNETASRHWRRILDHRDELQGRLGSVVDLRVALVSYATSVDRLLENPKVIESRQYEETREFAYRDALTGARNFRFLAEFLPQEIARSDQYSAPLSVIMVDIDDFKRHNDRYGHAAGNRALAAIAGLLTERLRRVDVLVRYGGEEFALVLPSTPKSAAGDVADRLRKSIECHPFVVDHREPVRLTVSLGVATYPADADSAQVLVRSADEALYRAKRNGKNQVRFYGSSKRSYGRVAAELPGQYRVGSSRRHPLTTVNLSIGGMLFRAAERPVPQTLVEARVELPENHDEITACGRIVHVEPAGDGLFEAAMRIVEIGAADRFTLAAYLRRHAV